MTMEGIAKRAGVGKQTIYRWWPSKAAIILEALNDEVGSVTDCPSPHDLASDLSKQMTGVAKVLASERFSPYSKGLIPAAQNDPDVAKALLEELVQPRVDACCARLERAQQEGQLRADVDLEDVVELIYAPMYYRLLLHTRPVKPAMVDSILRLSFEGWRRRRSPAPARPRSGPDVRDLVTEARERSFCRRPARGARTAGARGR